MREDWSKLPELFDRALELDGERRVELLDEVRVTSPELAAQLDELLAASGRSIDEEAGRATARELVEAMDDAAHPAVPGYQLLECIGRGGMGAVYRAFDESSNRVVALKALSNPLGTAEVRRRFQYEADVLRRLDHPSIASVYEAGTFDSDFGPQPFFAMELVPGSDIVDYATSHHLDHRASLEMLATVCDAVHHAHQKGVVHRDLKPANILVPDDGVPRVLDFGIARATDLDLDRSRQPTRTGQIVGTVGYMSPEQAAGNSAQVDARSDVYALGVLGYELLTGELPNPRQENIPDLLRSIIQDSPRRLGSFQRQYRGDLETIFAKALEKEPSRRYPSTAELGAEIRRYLANQPIVARPASSAYRFRKFVRRHRGAVGAVATAFVLLVLGLAGTMHGRRLADVRYLEAEQARSHEADRAEEAERALGLVRELFAAVQGRGREARVIDALDASADSLVLGLGRVPRVEARVRHLLGVAYASLGEAEVARRHLERAQELFADLRSSGASSPRVEENALRVDRDHASVLGDLGRFDDSVEAYHRVLTRAKATWGPEHPETWATQRQCAMALRMAGRFDASESLVNQVIATLKSRARDGVSAEDALVAAEFELGCLYSDRGDHQKAIDAFEAIVRDPVEPSDTVSVRRRKLSRSAKASLAHCLSDAGRHEESIEILNSILPEFRREYGENHLVFLGLERALASNYFGLGRYEEADALASSMLARQLEQQGETHPSTLATRALVASLLRERGEFERALELERAIADAARDQLGAQHPVTIQTLVQHGSALMNVGDLEGAESVLEHSLVLALEKFGIEEPFVAAATANLAQIYARRGEAERGIAYCRPLLERLEKQLPDDHQTLLQLRACLANLYLVRGDLEESRVLYQTVLDSMRAAAGDRHPGTILMAVDLGRVYVKLGRFDEALEVMTAADNALPPLLPKQHPLALRVRASLGTLYREMGRLDEAEATFEEVVELQSASGVGPKDLATAAYRFELAAVYSRSGRYDDARALLEQVAETYELIHGPDHPKALGPRVVIAEMLIAAGRPREAEPSLLTLTTALESSLGATANETLIARRVLAKLYVKTERFTEAESICRDLVRARAATASGAVHPGTTASAERVRVGVILADSLRQQGRYAEALPEIEAAERAAEALPGSLRALLCGARRVRGQTLAGAGRIDEAETVLLDALDQSRNHPERSSREKCLEALSDLYRTTGRTERAAPLLEELETLRVEQQSPPGAQ